MLKKEIDINNLQKVRVVSGSYEGEIGVVVEINQKYNAFLVAFEDDRDWFKSHQLEVIEEPKDLTVREVVEWLKNQNNEGIYKPSITIQSGDIGNDFYAEIIYTTGEGNLYTKHKELTDLIRNKPTESELVEQFKELSMEEKVELLKNTK